MRVINADSLTASLLDCPDDEEIGLKNAREAGIKENDDTVIIDFWRRCKQSFANFVNAEPTVDPVKHAYWINNEDTFDTCRCSQCGCFSEAKYPYCCHCGAKMSRSKRNEVTE